MSYTLEPTTMKVGYLCTEIENQHIIPGKDAQNFNISEAAKKGIVLQPKKYMRTQRRYVYKPPRATNLIMYTAFKKSTVPEVFAYRSDSESVEIKIFEGQQRTTSFFFFVHNKFKLNLSDSLYQTFKIDNEEYTADDLNGKYFSELPKEIQERILNVDIRILIFNNCSEREAKNLFVTYSEGTLALTDVDKQRNMIDDKTLGVLDDILNEKWIYHMMTVDSVGGNYGLNLLLQIMTLLYHNGKTNLSKKIINSAISDFRQKDEATNNEIQDTDDIIETDDTRLDGAKGIPQDIELDIRNASKYLSNAIDIFIKHKKKTDTTETKKKIKNYQLFVIPLFKGKKPYQTALFWGAIQAYKNNIPVEVFSDWVFKFFKEPSSQFIDGLGHRGNKSGDQENIEKRLQAINEALAGLKGETLIDITTNIKADTSGSEANVDDSKQGNDDIPNETPNQENEQLTI
jgi:hypothetical protein